MYLISGYGWPDIRPFFIYLVPVLDPAKMLNGTGCLHPDILLYYGIRVWTS